MMIAIHKWLKPWLRRQRSFKRTVRRSQLFAVFGHHSLHRDIWRADRRSLTGGLALGLFITFTPTIPFQMLLAATGAILLKVNLPIALTACWITNPLTAVPVYMSAWRLGRSLIARIAPLDEFINLFVDGSLPGRFIRQSLYLWVGALVYAASAALLGYGLLHLLWGLGSRLADTWKRIEHPNAVKAVARGLLPLMLLLTGLILQISGRLDSGWMQHQAMAYARHWWMPAALTALMTGMYALALPGSIIVILMALLYPPLYATLLAATAGLIGSLLAYYMTRTLTAAHAERYAHTWLFQRIRHGTGFWIMLALRVLPGFPHAILNYSAGILHMQIGWFALSTATGFAIKGFVYTSAIHNATSLGQEPTWSLATTWPLLVMALLAASGWLIEHRLACRREEQAVIRDQ